MPKLDDYPNLKAKFLNELDDAQRAKFVEDFKDAEEEIFVFFEENVNGVKAWEVAKASNSSIDIKRLKITNIYITNNPDIPLQTISNGISEAGGHKQWVDTVINGSYRNAKGGKLSLEKALKDFGFTHAADAAKKAKNVNKNNINGLDNGLEEIIPNPEIAYSKTRLGREYKKGEGAGNVGEKWKPYFDRMIKPFEDNTGQLVRAFNRFESHHIFPVDLLKTEAFRKWYELHGYKHFSINGENSLENLIMLEAKRNGNINDAGVKSFLGGVHSRHDGYTSVIEDYFKKQWNTYLSDFQGNELLAAKELDKDIMHLSQKLKEKILEKSVFGDTEIVSFWENVNFKDLIR